MQALVKVAEGPGNMEVREVPQPRPGPGEVRIQVAYTGICGSDLHIHDSDIEIPVRPPVVIGHEFSGRIDMLGEGVTGFEAGERVTSETAYSFCGQCESCRSGFYNLCRERRTLGYWYNGAFAPYVVVPAARVHRLPASVTDREGALTEPLACCVHGALELADIRPGDRAVVIGPGPIGLLTLQLARVAGARVAMVGTAVDQERLEMARRLGAELSVAAETDGLDALGRWMGPEGADVVLECSGSQGGTELGLELVRRRGQLVQIGLHSRPITLPFHRISYKEVRVTGSLGSTHWAWLRAIDLMQRGLLHVEGLISDVLPLAAWQEGFQRVRTKQGLKILLQP